MKPEIALESTFKKALEEGINIFIGSGFSTLAKDTKGNILPVGNGLLEELRKEFKDTPDGLDLPKTAIFLEKTDNDNFQRYIRERFQVDTYDDLYANLLSANIKGIYTTNIDDLIIKIYGNSSTKYINDVTLQGATFNEQEAVTYVPLHGAVYNKDRKLIFSSADIASAFTNDRDIWQYLRAAIEKYPTLFWGYSLNDSGVIQTLFSNPSRESYQKTKWIVSRQKKDSDIKYFETLGLNMIISDVSSMLEYFANVSNANLTHVNSSKVDLARFKDLSIPKQGEGPSRPLTEFFMGSPAIWNDVFSNKIVKTSHYEKVIELVNKNSRHVMVLGTPVSGKSTLMMQIAANFEFNGYKLLANRLSIDRAQTLSRQFTTEKLLLFIDDLRDNLDSLDILLKNKNIKLVCFEREHNFEIISHKVDQSQFEFHDITVLSKRDIQAIYNSIPQDIRKNELKTTSNDDSIFEFICEHVKRQSVRERFLKVIKELESHSEDLVDLFVMTCYCHNCRIPVSIDMAYAFLSDNFSHYQEINDKIEQLGKLIAEYDFSDTVLDQEQDYFQPRSNIVADTILNQVPNSILRRVLDRFHKSVPIYRTVNYDVFKKYAFDKDIFAKAYSNWREGKAIYEFLYERENDYYIIQQGALYLASKKQFTEAFYWIDLAIQKSKGRIFSIKNSHAIILFEANINGNPNDSIVRKNLDMSMSMLTEYYTKDRRTYYHVKMFGVQAIEYHKRFNDTISIEYLKTAQERLTKELRGVPFYQHKRLREILKDVSTMIDKQ